MEITTSSQTSLYKIISSTNTIPTNSDNLEFETLLPTDENSSNKTNTTSSSSNTEASAYIELSTTPIAQTYSANSTTSKLQSLKEDQFRTQQAQLPWDQRFVYPILQLGVFGDENDQNWESWKDIDPMEYKWVEALRSATNGNKYDGAPEFKAFVDKWISQGVSEDEALERAGAYVTVGLLDYGSQKAIGMYGLPLTDTKQHGLWLIDNEPLKKAVLETLDGLSTREASDLVISIFNGYPENNNSSEQTTIQELLQQYGVKLEDLKQTDPQFAKDNPEVFSGDINLKNDNSTESQEYNNFIFKTLIGFFKDRIESIDQYDKDHPNDNPPGYFESRKDSINLLIDTFQKKVDTYHANIQGSKGK